MAERAPTIAPGTVVLKPLPKGFAAGWPADALARVGGFVVRAEQVEGLSAQQTIEALRLTHHILHPQTQRRLHPYLDDEGQPLDALHLLRFPLTEDMARRCLVPTDLALLARMDEAQRMSVPFVGMSVARRPDGGALPGAAYTGTGVLAGPPLVAELFIVGRHPLPAGAELLVRR